MLGRSSLIGNLSLDNKRIVFIITASSYLWTLIVWRLLRQASLLAEQSLRLINQSIKVFQILIVLFVQILFGLNLLGKLIQAYCQSPFLALSNICLTAFYFSGCEFFIDYIAVILLLWHFRNIYGRRCITELTQNRVKKIATISKVTKNQIILII
jgi:hypothetical protein